MLSRIKKHRLEEIFIKGKSNKDTINETIEKNNIIIVDLSLLNSVWQKAFLEYLVNNISKEVFLLTRINEENCDIDFVNKIYNQKENIHFIPNVSYNYKKLPSVIQYCKNYMMLPSIYQRSDFLNANFALSNLIQDECIVFGEQTDNFLFLVNNYEVKQEEKSQNYRKIELSLIENDKPSVDEILGEKGDYFEKQAQSEEEIDHDKFLMEQLSDLDDKTEEVKYESDETFEEIENPKVPHAILKEDNEPDDFQEITEVEAEKPSEEVEDKKEEAETTEEIEITEEEDLIFPEDNKEKISLEEKIQEKIEEEKAEDKVIDKAESAEENAVKETVEIKEETLEAKLEKEPIKTEEITEEIEIKEEVSLVSKEEEITIEDDEPFVFKEDEDLVPTTSKEKEKEEEKKEEEPLEQTVISENELDFFELANQTSAQAKEINSNEINLSEIADNSIDDNFKDIINSKEEKNSQILKIDDNTELNLGTLDNQAKKENLPIFQEEKTKAPQKNFEKGDKVLHKSYGRGTVVNIIESDSTSFLQIEFEKSGKKLLDPKIANITLEQ